METFFEGSIMFLHGNKYLAAIRHGFENSRSARIAVAFWGNGILDEIPDGLKDLQIVCNLHSGACNPDVIARLIERGFHVKHSRSLHAKVFQFDTAAIVGSANASANGLGFEGRECMGWDEAGVLVDDPTINADISQWWEMTWAQALNIFPNDMQEARTRWARRRSERPSLRGNANSNLIDMVLTHSSELTDRELYLVCYSPIESNKTVEKAKETARRKYGEEFDVYWGWNDIPKDAILIDFCFETPSRITFNGIYVQRSEFPDIEEGGETFQPVLRVDGVNDNRFPFKINSQFMGSKRKWKDVINAVKNSISPAVWEADGGCCIRFDQLPLSKHFE